MKILVPVQPVARLAEGFVLGASEDAGSKHAGSERSGADALAVPSIALDWRLDEHDARALAAALALREGADEVIVVSIGREHAEEALRACLAKGADQAIQVREDSPDIPLGADDLALATVLAAVARLISVELIVCAARSNDGAGAVRAGALAGLLDIPNIALRDTIERGTFALPALLRVQHTAATPGQPTLREIAQARTKPLRVLGLVDLGLDAATVARGAGSRTVRLRQRPPNEPAPLGDSADQIAARILTILAEARS
jgi:electron transfer flavoprotein beta subunit